MKKTSLWIFVLVALWGCYAEDDLFGTGLGVSCQEEHPVRLAIRGEYLYSMGVTGFKTMELAGESVTELFSVPEIYGMETMFVQGDYLFVGMQSGMLIYSIENPDPVYLTTNYNLTACDQLVVNGKFMYVTYRVGTTCHPDSVNKLVALNLSDVSSPQNTAAIEMEWPVGLALFDKYLYVGEGAKGLKKFDLSDPFIPQVDSFYVNIPCLDLMVQDSRLIISDGQSVYQYAVEGESLTLLSYIP